MSDRFQLVASLDASSSRPWLEKIPRFQFVRTLRLCRNRLKQLPECLDQLPNLRSLDLSHNALRNLSRPLPTNCPLEQLVVRHNQLRTQDLSLLLQSPQTNLLVIDVAHNDLFHVPNEILSAKNLLVLNLSYNHIQLLPKPLLTKLDQLELVDLANNELASLPDLPGSVKQLVFSDNPFRGSFLSRVELTALTKLDLSRSASRAKFPHNLLKQSPCQHLDLSGNDLAQIPEFILNLTQLKTLNLSDNRLETLDPLTKSTMTKLTRLNVSGNRLESIPRELCELYQLRFLYANHNRIQLDGLPIALDHLRNLEHLFLGSNNLQTLPKCLERCQALVKIKSNRLLTTPEFITTLKFRVNLDGANVHFERFAGRSELVRKSKNKDVLFMNIDFSPATAFSDDLSFARPMAVHSRAHTLIHRPKSPALVSSGHFDEIFSDDHSALRVWLISHFEPSQLAEFGGRLLSGECYIFLLANQVHYWIGRDSSIDKRACVAIHATNLARIIRSSGDRCECFRESEGEESAEFWSLDSRMKAEKGFKSESALVRVTNNNDNNNGHDVNLKIFVLSLSSSGDGRRITSTYAPITTYNSGNRRKSLDAKQNNLLIDTGSEVILYCPGGSKASPVLRSQSRLLANQYVSQDNPGYCLRELSCPQQLKSALRPFKPGHIRLDLLKPDFLKLYELRLDKNGQISVGQPEHPEWLTTHVYLIDFWTEVYVWSGKRASKSLRNVAHKVVKELNGCSEGVRVVSTVEGCEDSMLKLRLQNTKLSVASPLLARRRRSTFNFRSLKSDLKVITTVRPCPITESEALKFIEDEFSQINTIGAIAIDDQCRSSRVPPSSFGQFYSDMCYFYMVTYHSPVEIDSSFRLDHGTASLVSESVTDERYNDPSASDPASIVIYFWQGRDCRTNKRWFHFRTELIHKIKDLLASRNGSSRLRVVRLGQQMESDHFMALFKRKLLIRKRSEHEDAEIFEFRQSPFSALHVRLVQIHCPSELMSDRCYVVVVRFESDHKTVYVWAGEQVSEENCDLCRKFAHQLWPDSAVHYVSPNHEPHNFFWLALNGPLPVVKTSAASSTRLFRCSNAPGFYQITEFYPDFCQDCLVDDDVFILDSGPSIFLWIGLSCSDTVLRLAFKSAQLYSRVSRRPRPDIRFTAKGREPKEFTRCFLGWTLHKQAPFRLERQFVLNSSMNQSNLPFVYAQDSFR